MFDIEFSATIKRVTVAVREKDDIVVRRCRMQLTRPFDTLLAAGMGADGLDARARLQSNAFTSATMPLDAVNAEILLRGGAGETVRIADARGIKAVAKAATASAAAESEDGDGDEPAVGAEMPTGEPGVTLEFEFPFSEAAWVFLGKNTGAWAEVTITRSQLSLPGTSAAKATADAARAFGERMVAAVSPPPGKVIPITGEPEEAPSLDDVLLAETPEEAETLREAAIAAAERAGDIPALKAAMGEETDTLPTWSRVPLLATPAPDTAGDRARRKRKGRIEDEHGNELVPPADDDAAGTNGAA